MNEQGHFAILKKPLPGMSTRVLPEGWVLSYQAPLRVQCSKDGRVVLLGIAWQFLPERGTPMEEIEKLCQKFSDTIPEEALLGMEESWCGRYVLLCQGVVYGDTCTLLPVFYSDLGVSSDCTLLAEQAGQPRKNYTMPPRRIMNWMPGPLTQYDGVRRMLPSQLYCYTTGEVRSRQLLAAHYLHIADEMYGWDVSWHALTSHCIRCRMHCRVRNYWWPSLAGTIPALCWHCANTQKWISMPLRCCMMISTRTM